MQNEFLFTLPVSGKQLTWRMLTVRQSFDITAGSKGAPHMTDANLLIARITKMDGDAPPTYAQWGEWIDFDLQAFAEEVAQKEALFQSTYRKSRMGEDEFGAFEKAIEGAQMANIQMSVALRVLLEAHEAAKRVVSPLGVTMSPTT